MDENESPTKKSKAKAPGKKAGLGPIPTSYDEASEEYKLIIKMREKDGQGWSDIRKVIEEITGVKFGGSSLSSRYGRMKANFTVFEKEDVRCPKLPLITRVLTYANRQTTFCRRKKASKRKWSTRNGRGSLMPSKQRAETNTLRPRCRKSLRN